MDNGLVSAIILTHNRLNLLKRAVDSVLSQTYPNIEVIIVDNGSTDGTKEYLSKLEGIIYVSLSSTIGNGCNRARNYAISISHGEWCAFLDDDDCWYPDKIKKQLEIANSRRCDVVYCGIRKECIDKDEKYSYVDIPAFKDRQGDLSLKSLYCHIALTSTLMIRKSTLLSVGCFDEKQMFWQETELIVRLSQKSHIYAVEYPLVLYRADATDPARQTNKFKGWEHAVKYLYSKHARLVLSLNTRERLLMYKRLLADASNRTVKMPFRHMIFRLQAFEIKLLLNFITFFDIAA